MCYYSALLSVLTRKVLYQGWPSLVILCTRCCSQRGKRQKEKHYGRGVLDCSDVNFEAPPHSSALSISFRFVPDSFFLVHFLLVVSSRSSDVVQVTSFSRGQ